MTSRRPPISDADSSTRVLGEGLAWLDGSEDRVMSTLLRAHDLSSSSDELAAHITDWPTKYHFSRLRSKILNPLRIDPGTRVLDLGGGTGTLSRKLGELGASVLLLDGSAERARVASVRCEELPNVSVAVGTIFDLDEAEPFDIVLVVGVLEYAQSSSGGPEGLLERAMSQMAPDGVIAIAIENAIGLKYLLGYDEDHVGVPWVGWEGYLGIDHLRTHSRRELASILTAVGLPEQAWFYPLPDYKLPTVIVSDAGYALDEPGVVDAIAPQPCTNDASLPTLLCDPRAAHWTMLRAGLGREVANSFLVVAGKTEAALDAHVDRETLAWLPGGERRARFMRDRRLISGRSGLTLVDDTAGRAEVGDGWLTQRRFREVPFVPGDPLDRLLLASLAKSDEDGLTVLLELWAQTLRQAAVVAPSGGGDPADPFRAEHGRLALPSDHLDVQPANFVHRDGVLSRIDAEWEAPGLVDFALVGIRGLFYLSVEALLRGTPGRFSAGRDVAAITAALAEAAGIADREAALHRLPAAEAELQALVLAVDREATQASIDRLLRSTFEDLAAGVPGSPVTGLRRQLDGVSTRNRELEARLEGVEHHLAARHRDLAATRDELTAAQHDLAASREQLNESREQLKESQEQRKESQEQLKESQEQLNESREQLNVMGQSLSWRVTAPLRHARRLLRLPSSRP